MNRRTKVEQRCRNHHELLAKGLGQDASVQDDRDSTDDESIMPELNSPGSENDESVEWPLHVQIKQEPRDPLDEEEILPDGSGLIFQSAGQLEPVVELVVKVEQQETEEIPAETPSEKEDNCSSDSEHGCPVRRRKTKKNAEGSHKCGECDMSFVTPKEISLHLKFHRGEAKYAEPYACSECGFVSASFEGQKGHMRIHTGEKPYKCDTCGKAFRLKNSRNWHLRVHSAERKRQRCRACGRVFKYRASLVAHEKTHSSESLNPSQKKTFDCFCGRASFSSLGGLKMHERKAHVNDANLAPLPVLFSGDLR